MVDVNTIGDPDVPTADNAPLIVNVRDTALPCTVTPAWIVNVTPDETLTLPVITYGEPPVVQVVFDAIVPDTFVANAAETSTMQPSATSVASRNRHRSIRGPPTRVAPPGPPANPITLTSLYRDLDKKYRHIL